MLFVNSMSSPQGAKDYFTRQLGPSDYYVRDAADAPGQWHGLGAELLGLSGEVKRDDFFRLCDNLDPATGEPLTARNKAARRVAYDFTFDAPKAVTLALELGGDDCIREAFRASVAETMEEMEAEMHARVRTGGRDADRRTSNMIWAEFVHRTARPVDGLPDPQLHCHAVVFNATFDSAEDRWKAGQFGALVRDKLYYQSAFHARLAERLSALGYEVKREGTSFTLGGFDRPMLRKFSRRSAQIDAEADRLGVSDPKTRGQLGRRTREAKGAGESLAALQSAWSARLTDAEREAIRSATSRDGTEEAAPTVAAEASVAFAIAHCFERESVLPEKQLVAEALMQGVGKASVRAVWAQARRPDIIRRTVDGQSLATTREVYREELAMTAFARDGRGQCRKLGGMTPPLLDPALSEEQRDAALLILGSRDRVVGLRGGAGTGKTRMMQATVRAIETTGARVFTFAPSARASRGVLREEGFATADTVARLLTDPDLRQQIRGQVLWIDEAGLLSTRDMKRIFDLAKEEGCRVVLSGDSAQHGAVARGDALRLLERDAGMAFARLKDIRRQTTAEYREAVREISNGDARGKDGRTQLAAGLNRLDRLGAIVEAAAEERYRSLAADYADATSAVGPGGKKKTALVVSPTHREGEKVAAHIRDELKQRGVLSGGERRFLSLRSMGVTEAQRGCADLYRGGDVIRFHQNAKGFQRGERVTVLQSDGRKVTVAHADGQQAELPLTEAKKFEVFEARSLALAAGDRLRVTINGYTREATRGGVKTKSRLNSGDVFDVAGFTRQGDIRLANGFVVPRDYGGLAQGYVVTSHASQGSTVDRVLIALGAESLSAASRQQFYVSVSRGREAVRLYTDDKAALREAVQADASRLSATELLEDRTPKLVRRQGISAKLLTLQRSRRSNLAWRERALHGPWIQAQQYGRGAA